MDSQCVIINQLLNAQCVITNHSNIGLTVTRDNVFGNERKCLMTGLDISMQQAKSSHLSHSGLYYYLKQDKVIFEKIQRRYLSSKWKDFPIKKQIKEIAHNIRNEASNKRVKLKRLYPEGQQTLFDIKSQKI